MLMITVWTTLEGNNEHNGLRFYYYFFLLLEKVTMIKTIKQYDFFFRIILPVFSIMG